MSRPLVSVLMPVFRTPSRFFREAAESILAQSLGDLELIVVEDPSEQMSDREAAGLQDKRLRYIRNESRMGLVAQRNRALSLARGEFIAKADSDDVSEPNRLLVQTSFLQENPEIGVVGSTLKIIDPSGVVTGYRDYPSQPDTIRRTLRRRNPIAQPAVCFRRSLYQQHGGYPDGFPVCQDYAYWSYLASQGVQFANLKEPLVRYRQHDRSIKATRLRESLEATIRVKQTYWLDELTFGDQLRILGERTLKYLPVRLVDSVFSQLTYQRTPLRGCPRE